MPQLNNDLSAEQDLPSGKQSSAAQQSVPLGQDRELLEDFLNESAEHLGSIEADLLEIERDAANMESLHSLFRSFHTVKGIAGFLDLNSVRDLAHEVEALLDLARNQRLTLTPARIDVILTAKDFLTAWCGELRHHLTSGAEMPSMDITPLIVRIRTVAEPNDPATQLAQLAVEVAQAETVVPAKVADVQPEPEPVKTPERSGASVTTVVKVDTAKLDFLVDMVGEMMITQSLVRHHPAIAQQQDTQLNRSLSQLSRITSELQKTAMSMRMVPVGHVFQKMTRLVRDLSRRSGKQASLLMTGENTELDRNVVEELADPLMHMVRNAVDHGLETPAERIAAGKNPEAHIYLRATHQSGCIVIEVADDGRGLNRDRILQKAIQKGLVAPGGNLPEAEIFHLIFHPGFSTAEKVTDVSGRGVGMDVVKKQIQKLRGRIEIISALGRGTTFRLNLPLTLAIVDGLVVRVGTERFILPIYTVREMLRPSADMVHTIEGRAETLLVRGEVIPLIRLARRLGLSGGAIAVSDGVIVLLESEGRRYGLLVDELIGKQEVVIKSLGEMFTHLPGLAGGAILGDGRVGLILDPEVILRRMPDAA